MVMPGLVYCYFGPLNTYNSLKIGKTGHKHIFNLPPQLPLPLHSVRKYIHYLSDLTLGVGQPNKNFQFFFSQDSYIL